MAHDARVLIVGGGARVHALAEALHNSPSVKKVIVAPGTTGLEHCGFETAPVSSQDLEGLAEYALMEEMDLTVVGPNTPLVDGIVDVFEAHQLPIFGPNRWAARLEGSKIFARLFMNRLGVPTPRFAVCDNAERALHFARTMKWPRVFKADGISYGKGVRVTHHFSEVEAAVQQVLEDNVYGLESKRILVEERLDGVEVTIFTLVHHRTLYVLGTVLNYPRLYDDDDGPPTRGMGQVAPAPQLDGTRLQQIVARVLQPTIEQMTDEEIPLCGALSVDLMMVDDEAFVIDYNVRFGDPVTQTLLSAYNGDFYAVLQDCRAGHPEKASQLQHDQRPRISVVITAEGYPSCYVRGDEITVDEGFFKEQSDLWLYEDGVKWTGDRLETTGGRTYTLVAAASTVAEARTKVYNAIEHIHFRGMHFRTDIGADL